MTTKISIVCTGETDAEIATSIAETMARYEPDYDLVYPSDDALDLADVYQMTAHPGNERSVCETSPQYGQLLVFRSRD